MTLDHDYMVANLLGHYEESGMRGQDWYYESRHEARRLARKHGVTVAVAAGVIAALSPRTQWSLNKRNADACLGGETVKGLGLSRERAERIRDGERPLSVLRGPKTRAFYRAIMGDETAGVIDVHMMKAAGYPEIKGPSLKQYDEVVAALQVAADQTTHGPATFQAIVWTQVRGGGE